MHTDAIHSATRRRFTLAGSLFVASWAAPSLAQQAAEPFKLDPLPYAADALEPVIDAQTMRIHHDRHHQGYVDKLNAKVAEFPQLKSMDIEQVQREISRFDTAVRNNAGGHYNHRLFWTVMAPPGKGGAPQDALKARIERDFGSIEAMRKRFGDAASSVFGSGWAWLIMHPDGHLAVTTTPNQDNPLMDVAAEHGSPLLALDVWEHAYYLKHQNKRANYVADWWQVANWHEVARRYGQATQALSK